MARGSRKCAVVLLLAVLVLAPAPAARAADRLFAWEVRSGNAVAHLLGSVHMLRKRVGPIDRKIENAFVRSDALVVETDIDKPGRNDLVALAAEKALYPAGDSLKNHLSPKTYDMVARVFGGALPAPVESTRPWALAMTLTLSKYAAIGLDPEYGVDRYFLRLARGKKKILELEPGADPILLLADTPDNVQELFLVYTISELDRVEDETQELLDAWNAGDAKTMDAVLRRSVEDYPAVRPVYELLVDRRNRAMARTIAGYLRRGGSYFVVVGAAHLVGSEGIPALLSREGFAVEQLRPSAPAAAR